MLRKKFIVLCGTRIFGILQLFLLNAAHPTEELYDQHDALEVFEKNESTSIAVCPSDDVSFELSDGIFTDKEKINYVTVFDLERNIAAECSSIFPNCENGKNLQNIYALQVTNCEIFVLLGNEKMFPNLQMLNLRGNEKLDQETFQSHPSLFNLDKIKVLLLDGIKIGTLMDIKFFTFVTPHLEKLSLRNCGLLTFNFNQFKMFKNLSLSELKAHRAGNPSDSDEIYWLNYVSFANNLLTSITQEDWNVLSRIKTLNLRNNKIENFSIADSSNIHDMTVLVEDINLSGNNIEYIDYFLPFLPLLKKLNLSYNGVKHIYSKVFALMPKLQTLDLSFNRLDYFLIKDLNISNDTNSFDLLLPNVILLDVRNNNFEAPSMMIHFEKMVNKNCVDDFRNFLLLPMVLATIIIIVICICIWDQLKKACTYIFILDDCTENYPVELVYDLFIYYHDDDEDMVETRIVPEFSGIYTVGTPREDFSWDTWVSFKKAVRKSRRFLYVFSNKSMRQEYCYGFLKELGKMQSRNTDFKFAGFFIETLEESRDRDLAEMIRWIDRRFVFANRWEVAVKNFVGARMHPQGIQNEMEIVDEM